MLSFLERIDDMAGQTVEETRPVLWAGVKCFVLVLCYLHAYNVMDRALFRPLLEAMARLVVS